MTSESHPTRIPADLVAKLRSLRARLAGYGRDAPTIPGRWNAVFHAYDQTLAVVADRAGIPSAPPLNQVLGRRRLTEPERFRMETELFDVGVDLGIVGEHLRARGLPAGPPPTPAPESGPPPEPTPAPRPAGGDASRDAPRRTTADGDPPARPPDPVDPEARARVLAHRLAAYAREHRRWPTKLAEWSADLDAYDETLVELARRNGVTRSSVPLGGRRRLLPEERARLEELLATHGLDLRHQGSGGGTL
ncbi:MAG: hypothetical protein ACRDZ9_07420 [Acidimicrobiales bacterium]